LACLFTRRSIARRRLAAAALAWAARGPERWPAGRATAGVLLAGILFVLAALLQNSLVGQGAAALLSALSCVTLGVLLAAVTPSSWLKVGIIAMAAADTWLVISDLLQAPNSALVAAAPAAGLPRLQSETFGSVSMGYGDMFVAGLLGAVVDDPLPNLEVPEEVGVAHRLQRRDHERDEHGAQIAEALREIDALWRVPLDEGVGGSRRRPRVVESQHGYERFAGDAESLRSTVDPGGVAGDESHQQHYEKHDLIILLLYQRHYCR